VTIPSLAATWLAGSDRAVKVRSLASWVDSEPSGRCGLIAMSAVVSTEDVQRAADVSPSQLYHYFGDRRSLIRAVIAHQTQAVLDRHFPLLDRLRLDDFEALDAWRDAVIGMQRAAGLVAETDPEARADLAAGFARWETAIRDGLDAMRARGELRPDADTGRLALMLLAAARGGQLLTQVRRDTDALEAALDGAIDQIRAQRP